MLDKKLEPGARAKSVSGSGEPWRPLREIVLSLPIADRPVSNCQDLWVGAAPIQR